MSGGASRRRVVVAGAVARKPFRAGHASVFLQWLLGLHQLGHDVVFIDHLGEGEVLDDRGRPCDADSSVGWRWLETVLRGSGFGGRIALVHPGGTVGVDTEELGRWTRGALVLDVMGYLGHHPAVADAGQRVYVDIDPGFPQLWQALGLYDGLEGYDTFVTVGQQVGRAPCRIPTGGIEWQATLPPMFLPAWPATPLPPDGAFTSVGTWRGANGPIDFEGERYGLRAHSLRRLVALPSLHADARFELALDIDASDEVDRCLLLANGWRLVDPREVSCSLGSYAAFIRHSLAEILVAKDLYVRSRSGWVSDRSACYLASGRPVVAQDTGLAELFGDDEGLLLYDDVDEAARAVSEVRQRPHHHAEAARRLAVRAFDSDVVLTRLLAELA